MSRGVSNIQKLDALARVQQAILEQKLVLKDLPPGSADHRFVAGHLRRLYAQEQRLKAWAGNPVQH